MSADGNAPAWLSGARARLALALALPVLAGIAWQIVSDAPRTYPMVNAGALLPGLALTFTGKSPRVRGAIAWALLALLAVPLFTGPSVDDVRRWIPLGAIALNSGLLCAPALAVLAAQDQPRGGWWIAGGMILAVLQPDAALMLALGAAAIAIAGSHRRWSFALLGVAALAALPWTLARGSLAPVPFVEGVVSSAWAGNPPIAAGLIASWAAAALLIAREPALVAAERGALFAVLAGFAVMSLFAPYPAPLIGYGPAAILGMGLALGFGGRRVRSGD